MKCSFISPAQLCFHTFPGCLLGWDAFVSTLPCPLTPPSGSVHGSGGNTPLINTFLARLPVYTYGFLVGRKGEEKGKREESLSFIKPWKHPHLWEQMAFQLTPSCAQQRPRAHLVLLCKEERENQITETSTGLQCKANPALQKPCCR